MRDPVILGHLITMVYNSSKNQGDRKNGKYREANLYKEAPMKFFNNVKSNYFVMRNPYHCVRTTLDIFRSKEWPVFCIGPLSIRFSPDNGTRLQYMSTFRKAILDTVDKMYVQSLTTMASDMKEMLGNLFNALRSMLRIAQKCTLSNATALLDWLFDAVLLVSDIMTRRKVYGMNIVITLLRVFKLYKDIPLRTQSWSGLVMSLISFGVPQSIIDIVKRMSLFTSAKVMDDFSLFHQLINACMDTLSSFVEHIGFSDNVIVKQIRDYGKALLEHHMLLADLRSLYKRLDRDRKLFSDSEVRKKIFSLANSMSNNVVLLDWAKNSPSVAAEMGKIRELQKLALAYENNSRPEPVCMAFEGPPGVFKSTIMSMMLTALNKSVYSHQVKSLMDGKDFYDQYDNQDIMLMDDLGAGGDSQFRFLVNLISPIKYPLDCASEKLKDTKFFTSEAVLFTTNRFSTIRATTASSGIADLNAVKRRVMLIDFSKVTRKPGDDWITGNVTANEFSLEDNEYVPLRSLNIPAVCDVTNKTRFVGWLCAIYEKSVAMKKQYDNANELDEDTVTAIRDAAREWQMDVQAPGAPGDTPHFSLGFLQHGLEVCRSLVTERIEYLSAYVPPVRTMYDNFVNSASSISTDAIFWGTIIGITAGMMAYTVYYTGYTQELDTMQLQKEQDLRNLVVTGNTMAETIAKQTFFVEFIDGQGKKEKATGTISGHYIIAPWHAAKDCVRVSVLSKVADCRLIDNAPVTRVYTSFASDLVILKIPETLIVPFKSLSKVFNYNCNTMRGHTLITPFGCLPVHKHSAGTSVVYLNGMFLSFDEFNSFPYAFTMPGLCGSMLLDNVTGVIGAHVAGNEEYGRALLWEDNIKEEILNVIRNDKFLLDVDIKDNGKLPSGVQLNADYKQFTPKNTKMIPTHLIQMQIPMTKEPVDLVKYGPHTVKDVAKKSYEKVREIQDTELNFGLDYLDTLIEPFFKLTEQETVAGFDRVAKINMDKSTGIGCNKDRSVYINKEKGEFTPVLQQEISNLRKNVLEDEFVNLDLWIAKETLKDEIRPLSKDREPRSFRVLRFPINVLCKQYTGSMVNNIINKKFSNGVMIGINPYAEWNDLHNVVTKHSKGIIAADIKKFDGGMLPQVQHGVVNIILKKFIAKQGNEKEHEQDKEVLRAILHSFIVNPVAVNDDVYLTTHSMPSGCYLTAIMNSMVQKVYTAMWYKHQVPEGTVTSYKKDVYDAVYGDDKLCSIRNKEDVLNALTMRDYFQQIGLDLSTADKQVITQPFDKWSEVNFLKRRFLYHPLLKKIMCPLTDDTFHAMLAFADSSKNYDEVIEGKIRSYQHESFLREDHEMNMFKLNVFLGMYDDTYPLLGDEELLYMFKHNEVEYMTYED